MIAEGAHVLEIKNRLGHSSIKVTYDVYGHLLPNRDGELSERLDELARRTAASTPLGSRVSLVYVGRK